ncbi:MAG TPA: cobalamin-dependent protein [Candidatus Limnocylindria bacterium]|nr:cobalamin-dependent protein [Candidatus Limnocylindria bacterium]
MAEPMSQDLLVGALRAAAAPGGIATPDFIAAVLVDGDDDLAAWAIGQALEEQPRVIVFDEVVRRAMEIVGSGWESGRWSISQEHLATGALMASLARLRPPDRQEARVGPVAILAAPEGEQHVTGLACLAQILEEHGWRVENLGANVPGEDLQRFVAGREVDLVALSIVSADRMPELLQTVRLLRSASERPAPLPIIVGGRGVADIDRVIPGVDHVATSLGEAEQYVVALGAKLGLTPGR